MQKEEVTYAIGVITVFGIIAMLSYPFLAHFIFDGDELFIGLFLGTSIHETAQVAGSGLIYSTQFDTKNAGYCNCNKTCEKYMYGNCHTSCKLYILQKPKR